METLSFDSSALKKFVHPNELGEMQAMVTAADSELRNGTGAGADFRDWLHLPTDYDKDEFARIKAAAKRIQADSEVLVVIGIGGSYLGARMAVDFLHHSFYQAQTAADRKQPLVLFAGNSLSSSYIADLIDVIGDRDFSVNVISKSGTTTEPSIAFRVFRQLLEDKYGVDGANARIYATTDRQRPIAVSGADIDQLMAGAAKAEATYVNPDLTQNEAYQYAAYRNILYRKGYTTELLENYEPNMTMLAEWWKQLAGESEGKDQKGIYPSSANFTTDLHSLGQYIQEGRRNLMETVVKLAEPNHNVKVPSAKSDLDGLKYLEGKEIDWVNTQAYRAVVAAHTTGGVPVMTVNIAKEDEFTLGYLIYFFEVAIAISGYLNGINPFNQPGVEAYKTNMFGLLGKPGFEEIGEQLKKE
ncbi:glucose-6-phosphate isomerase, partial [Limosilactobacillus fermentum]|uniref:glucose-6-phosphate isomerase n=1 Tax=Limosilactobacillus fermentum TaxID=1613 RepID=UPI000C7BAD5E